MQYPLKVSGFDIHTYVAVILHIGGADLLPIDKWKIILYYELKSTALNTWPNNGSLVEVHPKSNSMALSKHAQRCGLVQRIMPQLHADF